MYEACGSLPNGKLISIPWGKSVIHYLYLCQDDQGDQRTGVGPQEDLRLHCNRTGATSL